ncbi:MAG TPA: cation diffusion facilitator family transporter, partial [Vicinamibacterales bacterium]|nr:cation diffusion facilitator family transporter [Vicinamibacterales bacterium]
MLRTALVWLGFAQPDTSVSGTGHGHDHGESGTHGHTHGVIDPTIATTARGIWAIKWSFVILAVTAVLQIGVVFLSGSVALLADTIHNLGDAVTAIPLWIAFQLVRRKPSARFTYGLGKAEDLAGAAIVAIILFSAIVALYESIDRLMHPQTIALLWAVAVAGVVGFIGNEAVAVYRIRVGREIESAALIADGYHARTDGFTSLAVVLGAVGVWLGYPIADPLVGLLITLAIFGIVWQSAKAVFTRMLDGVESGVVEGIRHAAAHVGAVKDVRNVRARWLGHRLTTEMDVAVANGTTVQEADAIAAQVEAAVADHVPALASARVRVRAVESAPAPSVRTHVSHRHAPAPVPIKGALIEGVVDIAETPDGERMRLTAARLPADANVSVVITRPEGDEHLPLTAREAERAVLKHHSHGPADAGGGHDHVHDGHQHGHHHGPADYGRAFAVGVTLNVTLVIAQAVYGVVANSVALLADAAHNFSDVLGLLLAWGAIILAKQRPSRRFTYGLRGSSILAALANGAFLLLATGGIAWEAIQRFAHPEPVEGTTVIVVAALGIAVNTATALLFMSGRKGDLNIRGAFLHMAADAIVSLGVVLAGIGIVYTGWLWLDPVTSLVISLVIVASTWGLLRDAVRLALHAVPESIEAERVRDYLAGVPGVVE